VAWGEVEAIPTPRQLLGDPWRGLGTYGTPDPLDGIAGTTTETNPYHYTDNDPTNKTDPAAWTDWCSSVDRIKRGVPPRSDE